MPAAYLVIINLMRQKYNSDAAEFFYDINNDGNVGFNIEVKHCLNCLI